MVRSVAKSFQSPGGGARYERDVAVTALNDQSMTRKPADKASRFWDKIADGYAKQPIADPAAYERKLEATRARLQPDHVVLDIGCGTGSLALTLAPLVAHVHALDLSAEMVRIANEKAEASGTENVTFYNTSVETESAFAAETFDTVCAYNILHLVDDPRATLDKLFRLLRPGGSLVSTTPCLGEGWMPYGLVIPVMRLFGKAPMVVQSLRVDELMGAMKAAGFIDIGRQTVSESKTTAFVLARKPG